jgi:uncharacterized protein (DUF4415 family)
MSNGSNGRSSSSRATSNIFWAQIDEDLMTWFRQQGEDWPARINAVLRQYVEARRRPRKKTG